MTVRMRGGHRTFRMMVDGDIWPGVGYVRTLPPPAPEGLSPPAAKAWILVHEVRFDLCIGIAAEPSHIVAYAEARERRNDGERWLALMVASPGKPEDAKKRRTSALGTERGRQLARDRLTCRHLEIELGLALPGLASGTVDRMFLGDLYWWLPPMIEAELYWFADGVAYGFTPGVHAEYERRIRAASALPAERIEQDRRAKRRARDLRLSDADHAQRSGRRGGSARQAMVRPTAEREAHDEVLVEDRTVLDERGGGMIRARGPRVVTQTPLDRYLRRGSIGDRQHKAGEKLRSDWYVSGLEPHVVANLLGSGGGECGYGMAKGEGQAIAREEWRRAVKATGIRLSPILIAVCCEDRTAAEWLLSTGFRGRAEPGPTGNVETAEKADYRVHLEAMVTLKLALDVLADHYGY